MIVQSCQLCNYERLVTIGSASLTDHDSEAVKLVELGINAHFSNSFRYSEEWPKIRELLNAGAVGEIHDIAFVIYQANSHPKG